MLTTALLAAVAAPGGLLPISLRSEALTNPVGVDTAKPRLSWKLAARERGARGLKQSAYRIVAGRTPGGSDLWDTGRVSSPETYGVRYNGAKLGSGQKAYWTVEVFDEAGRSSGVSRPAEFSVGLLDPSDWKADWIGYDAPAMVKPTPDGFEGASWLWSGTAKEVSFRKTITVKPGLLKARARMTADDQFVLKVNGKEIAKSDGQENAWRRPVDADLASALKPGENQIEVLAKDGGSAAGFLGRIQLSYEGGATEVVASDATWQANGAPAKVVGAYGTAPWGKIGPSNLLLPPPRFLRHEFQVAKPVKRAVLYGTALGLLDLRLNGGAVSDELFTPGWTDYTKRVHARGHDVTKAIRPGANALGAILGDGWYAGYVGFGGIRHHYGSKIRAKVQLEIEYEDGSRESIASSPSWKASTGPLLESDFLMGEVYDARLEAAGWDKPGYSDSGWKSPDVGAEMDPAVEPFPGQPVRPYAQLKAKAITEPVPGAYVLDLGQNIAGFARLRVRGKAGQKIVLRFAERLNPDGTFYTTNLRGARATDVYICKGKGVETWQPRFTFHGFQYIEVTGLGHAPAPNEVVGVAISSETPTTGTLTTSDPMLNRLVQNAWWTQRMNFVDVPTDCPQRDERLGWTGDAQAYVRTASMLTDVQPFFTKWLVALDDAQRADGQYPMVAPVKVAGNDGGPAWADAGVICPWTIYDVYGDRELLARHYPQMKKFVEFCVNRSTPDLLPPKQFHCFGDWLNINSPTPNEVIYTAYFAGSARLVSMAARDLGFAAEAAHYENLYQRVRSAFQKTYARPDGFVNGDSQCGYVLALAFDLLDPEPAKKAADRLIGDIQKRGWHLSTGFVGTRDIMHVLSKIGRNDVAFRLLHNTTFPSWGFTIVNGATSIWERWDGWTPEKGFQDPGMNSFAHYAFGAVVGWMFDQPAGISNLTPGFGRIRVAPKVDPKLAWLKSSYNSVRGSIVSEWKVSGKRLTMKVVVPPNVDAEIVVPATNVRSDAGASTGSSNVFHVGSGTYSFSGDLAK